MLRLISERYRNFAQHRLSTIFTSLKPNYVFLISVLGSHLARVDTGCSHVRAGRLSCPHCLVRFQRIRRILLRGHSWVRLIGRERSVAWRCSEIKKSVRQGNASFMCSAQCVCFRTHSNNRVTNCKAGADNFAMKDARWWRPDEQNPISSLKPQILTFQSFEIIVSIVR